MSAVHPQAQQLLEKLGRFALFAELFDFYLCRQGILQAHLADTIFVRPATISHWRKNRRIPDNLAIVHQVNLALRLSPLEQENLIVAWYSTRMVRDLIPYLESAMRSEDVSHALQIALRMIGKRPLDFGDLEVVN